MVSTLAPTPFPGSTRPGLIEARWPGRRRGSIPLFSRVYSPGPSRLLKNLLAYRRDA